jgi:hypothetical protein
MVSLQIFGFDRATFSDVPDLVALANEARGAATRIRHTKGNIRDQLRMPKPSTEHARPMFAVAGR